MLFGKKDQFGYPIRPEFADFPADVEAHKIVRQICDEVIAATGADDLWENQLHKSARWKTLKQDAPALQIAVAMTAASQALIGDNIGYGLGYRFPDDWQVVTIKKDIVSQILLRKLPFGTKELTLLLEAWFNQGNRDSGIPGEAVLAAVERFAETAPLTPEMKAVLRKIPAFILSLGQRDGIYLVGKSTYAIGDRIGKLLDPSPLADWALPAGPFAKALCHWIVDLPEAEHHGWLTLAASAAEAGDKPRPSSKWLAAVGQQCGAIGLAPVANAITRLLDETTPNPHRHDESLYILKGFIWTISLLDHREFFRPLGRFAEKCFFNVSGVGPRSVKLGNAALWALAEMAGTPGAVPELFRLREKIKYPLARKAIDKMLAQHALGSGQSVEELEDLSLPDFGIGGDGVVRFDFGGARAELCVHATGVEQAWFSGAGKPVKAVPAEVRKDHAVALAAFRQAAKDIEVARALQAVRLEQSWLEERSWSLAEWKVNFLNHPLRRPLVEALVWRIGGEDMLPRGDVFEDVRGRVRAVPDNARIVLWHPLDDDPSAVLAWRARIIELGVTQPVKQAHREIYALTDAERRTRIYSNRFAAHILRQHQFAALCRTRGWRHDLRGPWDTDFAMPARHLPKQKMTAEYEVEGIEDGNTGSQLHITSDRVRFLDVQSQPVELEAIAPVLFSEIMRDIDLFVAVTSVANDPEWTDGGPDGRHGQYWREWSFGELGQSAATRKELISWIAPKLSIADRLEISGNFLVVQGKRQKYAIHFGSGNIQILPGNRYLCIVPDRAPVETKGLKLPFAGDGVLSTILAKAFMLVDESRIKDRTILTQL